MAKKSYYKKLVDKWLDDDKSQQRARENQFYQKAESGKVGAKPKGQSGGQPRADHKHNYQPVVIWYKCPWNGAIDGSIAYRCSVCGKKDTRWRSCTLLGGGTSLQNYYGELDHYTEDEHGNLMPTDKSTHKRTIFLGGSKTVCQLDGDVQNHLVRYMNLGYDFLIGDCTGADCVMQKFFAENDYKNVTVYYSGERARLNLGAWQEKHIFVGNNKGCVLLRKGEQMAVDCDQAFVVLHGQTHEIMKTIERVCNMHKTCAVAICTKGKYNFFCLYELLDLTRLKGYLNRAN